MKITSIEVLCLIFFLGVVYALYLFLTPISKSTIHPKPIAEQHLQSLVFKVIAETGMTKGSYFKRTITHSPHDNSLTLGGNITLFDKTIKHPSDGKYFLFLQNTDGTFKRKLDTNTRLAMEISPPSKGDGFIGVAFADGHIEYIERKKIDFTNFDPKEFLSIKGPLNP